MPTPSKAELKLRLEALEAERAAIRRSLGVSGEPEGAEGDGLGKLPNSRILDNAADGIFTLDAAGRVTYINLAGGRMLGVDRDELLGSSFMGVLGAQGNREMLVEIGKWLRDNDEAASFLLVDVPVVNRFGNSRWLSVHLQRGTGASGEVVEVQGIARDITEQHRLQQALRRSEEHYRGIIENMDLGILEVDNEERITRAFPKFCEIVGYEEIEMLGKKASDLFMQASDRLLMDSRTAERNAGESGLYEMPIRTKTGDTVWLLISGVPIFDEAGKIVGSMGIHYDISERKRDEEQLAQATRKAEAATKAERAFLAKMSHEIRTPMNAILGMTRLLEDTKLNGDQQEFVQAISQGGALLKGLLDDVLDLARLEEGQFKLNPQPTRVQPLFEAVMEVYRLLMSEKGVELHLHWDAHLDQSLELDRGVLSQILMNLVGNAAKFTPKGRVDVYPRLEEERDRMWMVVEVVDTGVGMSAPDMQGVFGRFQQAAGGAALSQGGSGLGLAIVKELCMAHGGSVEVESEPDKGSTFRVMLEVSKAADREAVVLVTDPAPLRGKRILIAEDNAVNLLYLTRLLKNWAVDFQVTGNGHEVMTAWRKGRWDLILMDVQMPVCSGIEATRKIRTDEQGTDDRLPIVGLSAFAFHKDVEDGLQAGMDGYLKKPYAPEELLRTLLNFLG